MAPAWSSRASCDPSPCRAHRTPWPTSWDCATWPSRSTTCRRLSIGQLPRLRTGRWHRRVRGRLADGLRPGAGRDHRLAGRAHRLSLATPASAAECGPRPEPRVQRVLRLRRCSDESGFPAGSVQATLDGGGTMGNVIASITTSVDGYVTGHDDGPEYGLGRGGERRCDRRDDLAHGSSSVECRLNRPGREPRLIAATPKTQNSLYPGFWPRATLGGRCGRCEAQPMRSASETMIPSGPRT